MAKFAIIDSCFEGLSMPDGDQSDFYEPIRAERKQVPFFDGLEVDGYRMPNGEFRVGITGASQVIGFRSNWLGRALDRGGNTVKTLRSLGFTQELKKVVTRSIRGGGSEAQTISLRDFNRLIAYGVVAKKKAALALHIALTELSLNDFFREAFGDPPLSIDEKRELFYKAYASTISPEKWREMDREEILQLALAGDHLYFPEYRDWEHIQPWRRSRKPQQRIKAKTEDQPSLEL
jgi:hypothetical protein